MQSLVGIFKKSLDLGQLRGRKLGWEARLHFDYNYIRLERLSTGKIVSFAPSGWELTLLYMVLYQ